MDIRSELEFNDLNDDSSIGFGQNDQEKMNVQQSKSRKYQFQMRDFFYIHLVVFVFIGLLSGMIIYFIENYSRFKNEEIEVSYINAWFISCTCICSCGLTTLDFAKLSRASQVLLLVLTVVFGITISALPILAIKACVQKHINEVTLENELGKIGQNTVTTSQYLPYELTLKLDCLPTSKQIRFRAYITIIILILATCISLYLCSFIIIGVWLDVRYTRNDLAEGNKTISPWYTSIVIVITGFNQNGLTPFSDGMHRFVNDVYINIFVMMVVMSGTSFFPFLLRNIVLLGHHLAPWRHKIVFDYILLNHHHLSTLLFPTLQTRIYLCVTLAFHVMAVSVSLILEMHNSHLAQFTSGTRILIFVFHSINARFAGFQIIDINHFTAATLMVYLLLMVTKPQMLSSLNTSRFEMTWISLRENQKRKQVEQQSALLRNSVDNVPALRRRTSSSVSDQAFVERYVSYYLNRQRQAIKQQLHKIKETQDNERNSHHVSCLHRRLFLLGFIQVIFKHIILTLGRTRNWLFIFIFLICAVEQERITLDPHVTVFKVVFELVSAFGGVGLTLGYPGVSSSFATILSPTSRVIVVITMLIGRHRGLLAAMKDQEKIEHSANSLLQKWKEKTIDEYEKSRKNNSLLTRL